MTAETDRPGRNWDEWAGRLGSRANADGEPTRWFEELWSKGARDEIDMLATGGEALVVQFVRFESEPGTDGPPWLLDRSEMDTFAAGDVTIADLDDRPHPRRPDGRPVWVARLRRADAS